MHRKERYVCVECGNSYYRDEVIEDSIGIGVNCPSCGGVCDPDEYEYECVGCGKDILSPHSCVWVDDDWYPLCEECSTAEADKSLHTIKMSFKVIEQSLKAQEEE